MKSQANRFWIHLGQSLGDNMNGQKIANISKNWYFANLFPSSITSPTMFKLVGSSASFIAALQRATGVTLFTSSLVVEDIANDGIAYAVLEDNRIVIGKRLFNKNEYVERFKTEEELPMIAMSVINGAIIHEALHLVHTKEGINSWADIVQGQPEYDDLLKDGVPSKLIFSCCNVVEDLYIEHVVPQNLHKFIWSSWEMFFEAANIPDIQGQDADGIDIFNACVFYKHEDLRQQIGQMLIKAGLSEVIFHLDYAMKSVMLSNRLRIGFQLAKLLHRMAPDDFDQMPEWSGGGVSGQDGEPVEVDGDLERMFEQMKQSIEAHADKELNSSAKIKQSCGVRWNEVVEDDIYDARRDARKIRAYGEFDMQFVQMLKSQQADNRVVGPPLEMGGKIIKSRLARPDKKIFGKRNMNKLVTKRKEIIFLADWSGSIRANGCGEYEAGLLVEVAHELPQARLPFSIYAHTTKRTGHDMPSPYLVHVASHNMVQHNVDIPQRVEAMRSLASSTSVDGAVLEVVATKFTNKPSERYIFVLSDGEPNCDGYRDRPAEDHTQSVVNRIREDGINVIVFSLVRSVIRNNDRIYGKAFNIDGSQNLAEQFRLILGGIF